MVRLWVAIVVAWFLSGCGIAQVMRDEQTIRISREVSPMKPGQEWDLGSVLAWPPHATAMVVDGKGNRCVRVAAGARVTGGSSEAQAKLDAYQELLKGVSLGQRTAVEQTVLLVNTPSELANVMDLVLFHHCIQEINGTFKDKDRAGDVSWKAEETMKLYHEAMDVIKAAVAAQKTATGSATARAGTTQPPPQTNDVKPQPPDAAPKQDAGALKPPAPDAAPQQDPGPAKRK